MNKLAATLALAIIMASMAVGARPVARVGEPLFENSGFENGDFRNWTAEGDAFKFQQETKGLTGE